MSPMATEPNLLYLGTEDGLRVLRAEPTGLERVGRSLDENAVRDVSVHPSDPREALIGCGLRGRGLHRTTDAGRTVETLGFEDEWVWGVERDPIDPETVYVGTEPPMLYRSTDGGATVDPFEGIDDLPSRPDWTFFHDPFRAGHVHGIAIHPDRPDRLFAGVEHGALLYTHDGGERWHEALVGRDLHRIAIDPADPDRVFAGTGAGLYRSEDAGDSWESVADLAGAYVHGVVFDPDRPNRAYVYADRDGEPVFRSANRGESWRPVGDGLPAAGPADTLRTLPDDPARLVYAGETDDGTSRLYASDDAGDSWHRLDGTFPKIWRLEVAPATV
ncbi:hypothetical protein [Halovivax sp.]|uniref:sialidase family protein n=1 Tax=Halovivax sp. TaxID=1935978 RepID=UPI0025C4B5ED|nr:hypothetical protein [Halovivax sp.]